MLNFLVHFVYLDVVNLTSGINPARCAWTLREFDLVWLIRGGIGTCKLQKNVPFLLQIPWGCSSKYF
ncbi:hypothetical protein Hanom_Chr12g01153361 [Helianthus anomalus]